MEAPLDWAYALFPLQGEDEEVLPLEWVVRISHDRIDRAERTGDEAHFGPVLHWAHILKAEQGPEGDWPADVNARTGAAVGADRTRAPAGLLARLDALIDSTEFEAAVARATPACKGVKGETNPCNRMIEKKRRRRPRRET